MLRPKQDKISTGTIANPAAPCLASGKHDEIS